jgi:hypothetical protein
VHILQFYDYQGTIHSIKTMKSATTQYLLHHLFHHPLAAIGTVLALFGTLLFFFFLVLDFATEVSNPYTSLLTFIVAPGVVMFGVGLVVISLWMEFRAAQRRGERIMVQFSIDPSSPGYWRAIYGGAGVFVVILILVGYTGVKAYHAVESVDFCGRTCHTAMGPQYVAHQHSAHARVLCVDCHIGPGFKYWVTSKIAGMRQLYAVATDSYQRPIPTPVHNLRPAQETCEDCHWPRQFYGGKFVTHTYYKTDEQNSPWTIDLLVKIGGGNPRTGKLEGIHWHMLEANTVQYIAVDEERQQIPWVRLTRADGEAITYTQDVAGNDAIPNPDDPGVEVRQFDCMDCHNRPTHQFLPPAKAVNLAMSQARIATELPFIRKKGVELLMADYDSNGTAEESIPAALTAYYQENYPEIADNKAEAIDKAASTLVTLYRDNFFPEMKTDYRTRTNNLSHFTNLGCFRCHNGKMVNNKGARLEKNCTNCHLIVAQGSSANLDDLQRDIRGLPFNHPAQIGGAWKQLDCITCHTHKSGY